jgi:hypothetical protein
MILEHPDLTCVAFVPVLGCQVQILKNTGGIEHSYSNAIKPIGVKKDGLFRLKIGNACGLNQVGGQIVDVNVVTIV